MIHYFDVFLGVRVQFDVSQPVGQRVVRARVRCAKCRVPKYEPIENDKVYKVFYLIVVAYIMAHHFAQEGKGHFQFNQISRPMLLRLHFLWHFMFFLEFHVFLGISCFSWNFMFFVEFSVFLGISSVISFHERMITFQKVAFYCQKSFNTSRPGGHDKLRQMIDSTLCTTSKCHKSRLWTICGPMNSYNSQHGRHEGVSHPLIKFLP